MQDAARLQSEFRRRFGAVPQIYRAPGRVNLIGEHTDYNGGFVMPVALQFHTDVAAAPRSDHRIRVHSSNFGETVEFSIDAGAPAAPAGGAGVHWSDYVCGVARSLLAHGLPLQGADLLVSGGVPLGAGLSSSAALEVATALALSELAGTTLEPMTLARLCQRAENEYVGMRCGIMDQFASAFGRSGHALCLDCRSLAHELVPLEARLGAGAAAARLVVCNTMVRHQLAGGEYNRRRSECERAVQALAAVEPGLRSLRDLTPELFERHAQILDPVVRRRCRHVVSENERVLGAAAALQRADLAALGALMAASHRSLRDDYEVSCDELDCMVHLAQDVDGTYGARMTGGGFGGCTVNLVRADAVERFCAIICERYREATGHRPEIHVCASADGAHRLDA